MKKPLLLLLLLFLMLLQSCWRNLQDDVGFVEESRYQPITQQRSSFEATMTIMGDRPVLNSGKIYVKDDLIYLNEKSEGFHIIDNSDPENPVPRAFLNIPLATDLAIRNNIVYVHHAVDLVAFTYNANSLKIVHRERNVFPELRSPDGYDASFFDVPEDEVVIGYELVN
ncbi:hypothetical protein FHG64_08330 [Antarcticibacterium flavum]|uniref:LVIVD repeat-containing protein n=1 Tax=Antarcticibacterium flavum TaxID=2058175 RepID=A0A5B7X239_9FLAO|nr:MULTISPECIES: hypothetical protein [Antarcticibacterium]MCM4161097.1 hypothetical protein [Antarcticibacterium sp. W02-3]QCY69399.1 hypothetical protein FHG64_08330 [Antarcticibacterium flavum]